MKGGITLAIYIAIGITGAAFGQPKSPNVFEYATVPAPISTRALPADGWLPPDQRMTVKTVALPSKPPPPAEDEIVVIRYGRGGLLHEHIWRFSGYRNRGTKVEIRGPCYSACTLVMAYVAKTDLCIAAGAYLAFHAVRTAETHKIMPAETGVMYYQQPEQIRDWIDRHGGHAKLPLDGFWTMYDRELWAMGYPKCT